MKTNSTNWYTRNKTFIQQIKIKKTKIKRCKMLQKYINTGYKSNNTNLQTNEGVLQMPRKNKSITFRCDERLSNKLTRVANLDNMSVGELCRNILERSLLNEQNKHQKVSRQKNL